MLQRFLLIWLILTSGLALLWPGIGLDVDPFVTAGGTSIQWLIVVIMFCIGALLPIQEVDALILRWPVVLLGTTVQYISMPLLAWLTVHMFSVDAETAAGILIVGCVPGAMASNVLTLTARGNVSYSVSLTTSATLLSPLMVPWILKQTISSDVHYDGAKAVTLLVLRVVLPVLAGHVLRRLNEPFARVADRLASVTANLAILMLIAIAVGLKRDLLAQTAGTLLGILLLINIAGYASGYLGGFGLRLPEAMRRALTLEVGMQNAGAGTALAIHLFGDQSPAVLPCVLYTFGCMLTGTLLATIWHRMPPDNAGNTSP